MECKIRFSLQRNRKDHQICKATTISSVCTKWRRFLHPMFCGTIAKLAIVCSCARLCWPCSKKNTRSLWQTIGQRHTIWKTPWIRSGRPRSHSLLMSTQCLSSCNTKRRLASQNACIQPHSAWHANLILPIDNRYQTLQF